MKQWLHWALQAAGEDDLVLGRITYQSPPQCTYNGMPSLDVHVYLDGTLIGSLTLGVSPTDPGATVTFHATLSVSAPSADTPHTLAAKVSDTCQEHFTVTDLKLDVAALT